MSFRFDWYLVVPDTDRARVLLVQDDQNWALPHFAFTEDRFGIVDHVSRAPWNAWDSPSRSSVAFPTKRPSGKTVGPALDRMPAACYIVNRSPPSLTPGMQMLITR